MSSPERSDACRLGGPSSAAQAADAVPQLRACLEHDPGYSAAYKLLGKALYKLEEFDAVRDVFTRGLPIALEKGDKQTEREILAFQKKLTR